MQRKIENRDKRPSISDHKALDWFLLDHRGQIIKDAHLPMFRQPVEELNGMLPIGLRDKKYHNILCNNYYRSYSGQLS